MSPTSKPTSSQKPGRAATPGAAKTSGAPKGSATRSGAAKNGPGKAPGKTPAAPAPVEAAPSQSSFLKAVTLVRRFERFARDISGVVLLTLALLTLLALVFPDLTGGVLLSVWRALLRQWFGWGSLLVVVALGVSGLLLLRRPQPLPIPGSDLPPIEAGTTGRTPWKRLFVLEVASFAALALFSALGGHSLERVRLGLDGGRVGWGLAEVLRLFLQPIGLGSPLWIGLIAGLALLVALTYGLGWQRRIWRRLEAWAGISRSAPVLVQSEPVVAVGSDQEREPAPQSLIERLGVRRREPLPAEFRKRFRVSQPAEEKNAPLTERDERLPPLDLLVTEQGSRPDERAINLTAGTIEKTLADFGIPTKVVGFRVGPTVTQFAVEPGFLEKTSGDPEEDANRQKVRVAQIAGLRRDLALALSAERLRIEAPVPGKPYIGIEVPNVRTSIVRLRPLLEAEAFSRISSPLAIALGRDVSGQAVVADLTRMPHMLIAGTTGSGKSVCIAALTTCLVMNNTPEDLRLVMIDPKMVELVRFNGLPHLYGKVETNAERIQGVLHWVVWEMDRRYKLLEGMSARNLETYNRKVQRRKGDHLPHIVVMIDELADLMMSAPEQTEQTLVRLAQMARATGIHLVVATQRPSVDVVTGLIKANFPARIAFAVAQSVDSRVILDTTGAESLLGHGDMLFLPPEASAPMRCQGVLISDSEVEKVITFWQQAHPVPEGEISPWEAMLEQESVQADRDDLVIKAIKLVRDSGHCSASLLQRRLRIGYPRAARLVDELEELGVIGPSQGGGREREVLIGPDDQIPGMPDRREDDDEDDEA